MCVYVEICVAKQIFKGLYTRVIVLSYGYVDSNHSRGKLKFYLF